MEPDSKPLYSPPASQCQISTTLLGTDVALLSDEHADTSCTRSASCSTLPGRCSRMSDRMLSTSNQYGPCVCSGDVVQIRTASNAATMSSAAVEDGASGADDVAERAALGAPLLVLVPAHAASRDQPDGAAERQRPAPADQQPAASNVLVQPALLHQSSFIRPRHCRPAPTRLHVEKARVVTSPTRWGPGATSARHRRVLAPSSHQAAR